MKKVLPYMMLRFTLYSADQNTSSNELQNELQVPSAMMRFLERLQSICIRRNNGFVTLDLELVRKNIAFNRVFMGQMVAGYALLEDVNARDILLGAALCGLAFQQIQILGLIDALKQNKCERDALKQEQDNLKNKQNNLSQTQKICCDTKTRRLDQQDQRLDRLEGLVQQPA